MKLFSGCIFYLISICDRKACSIQDPSSATVLVTGGEDTLKTVSRYSLQGWVEDLPLLNVGRYYHGCGGYVSSGDMVSISCVANDPLNFSIQKQHDNS